ncbi:hypothetical protein F5Y16DRAFT_406220 [Xylariaceae sp. FL0255]|nr:hypothetical protein F5Y16DRAFT_406220 [Xylariaceae sp. FL0255]
MATATTTGSEEAQASGTYEAGCHCGYIKFAVTLSPPLPEENTTQLTITPSPKDPKAEAVTWHNNSRERCASYRFNTKRKDQMFCPKCGASLGIDFEKFFPGHVYGISARTFYGVDLDKLQYRELDGKTKVEPAEDLSGHYWDEEKQEMK